MNPEREKLLRELRFVENSYSSGIITKTEHDAAKARVEAKIAALPADEEPPKQEAKPESPPVSDEPDKKNETVALQTYSRPWRIPKKTLLILLILAFFLALIYWPSPKEDASDTPEKRPECFYDMDCQKEGFVGTCVNGSLAEARCLYTEESTAVNITVISSSACELCDVSRMKSSLKQIYPGAQFIEIDSQDASDIIKRNGIDVLPAYIAGKEVKDAARYESTKMILIEKEDGFLIKPSATGSPYFFRNEQEKQNIALYIEPESEASAAAFENLQAADVEADIDIRFFTRQLPSEAKRQVCIREYSKSALLRYLGCNKQASCIEKIQIPQDKISACMENMADGLLSKDMQDASSFAITSAPTFVFNNAYKKGGSLSADIIRSYYCSLNAC